MATLRPKADLLGELGSEALLLPEALSRALEAKDRLKYCLHLLALAERRALEPEAELPDLKPEREAAGIEDVDLDRTVAGTVREGDAYRVPFAERIHRLTVECIDDLIAPLAAAWPSAGVTQLVSYRDRLDGILARLPGVSGERVDPRYLGALVRDEPGSDDSLGRLASELVRELGRLQETLSREAIDGAQVYGLSDDDRSLVRAFMAGVNETATLKFDHPGLGTTATRSGQGLQIHNEIAGSDAHLLVARVEGLTCTLSHADPHAQRARFFQALVKGFGVDWVENHAREAPRTKEDGAYHLYAGRFTAHDRAQLESFLTLLGSRLVFLIDWNRARKRLRNFVDGAGCLELLHWAADQHYGHRAFLQLGAERLVYEAVERATPSPIRYGQRLDEVLGREPAIAFLKAVLRITSDGLREGRSERLMRDEIRAELAGRFETVEHGILAVGAQHAACIARIARAVHEALVEGTDASRVRSNAEAAAAWEREADELVERGRILAQTSTETQAYARLLGEADDAADSLEDAAFLLTLLPSPAEAAPPRRPLAHLATLLASAAEEWNRCLATASEVRKRGARDGLQGFLESVDRIAVLEDQTDGAERAVVAALFGAPTEARALQLLLLVAQAFERAADALAHAALFLRDRVLEEATAR